MAAQAEVRTEPFGPAASGFASGMLAAGGAVVIDAGTIGPFSRAIERSQLIHPGPQYNQIFPYDVPVELGGAFALGALLSVCFASLAARNRRRRAEP